MTIHPDTQAIHTGEHKPAILGAVNMPIFQSSTYYHDPEQLHQGVRYHRLNNSPNHNHVAEKIAALEHGEAALITSSGMSAITTAVLALVKKGEHILAQNRLYAGTMTFFGAPIEDFGRAVTHFDLNHLDELASKLRPETKAIYVESLENPLLRAPDYKAIIQFARKHNLIAFIDNTFPSPVNFTPLDLGFDIVLHSATKYLNGHSDIIAGAVVGTKKNIETIRNLANILGGCLDPNSLFLLQRGLRTLGVRVRAHNQNAQLLAEALEKMRFVENVIYPGLPSHPDHARVKKFHRGFGGMLTFQFKGSIGDLETRLKRLKYAFNAPSLGGPETLLTLPVQTSFANFSAAEKKTLGLNETLVRISVGLEDPADLIADFKAAFDV